MAQGIKSITEAFSMQPITLSIDKKEIRTGLTNKEDDIKEIKLEVLDPSTNIYVGYNYNGKKMFAYLTTAVNVHYY